MEFKDFPVAVRSSATAEDLPDLSFAGQQDTYLNVIGEEEILKAVINCWSSLWTARAIGYRLRNHIPQDEVALAVVVQKMVPSDVSGVLFTANPLTGLRSETVIDATLGLGEALVSGQVEPDHYVVDSIRNAIIRQNAGGEGNFHPGQSRRRRGNDPGTGFHKSRHSPIPKSWNWRSWENPSRRNMSFPRMSSGLLQTASYTSCNRGRLPLFSRCRKESNEPLLVWFSFGAVQGLVGPITPIGQDVIRHVFTGGARLFDVNLTPAEVRIFTVAGERIWINITGVIRHPLGKRVIGRAAWVRRAKHRANYSAAHERPTHGSRHRKI